MWRQKEKNALCAADCFFVTHFPFRRPQSFRESARSPLFFLSFFLLFKHTGWLVMVAFSPSLKKSVYFPLTCLFAASQSLSVPLARVTHLFCLKVNVGQSSLIAKEWIYCKKKKGKKRRRRKGKKQHFSDSSTHVCSNLSAFSVSLPRNPSGFCAQKLWSIWSQRKDANGLLLTSTCFLAHQMLLVVFSFLFFLV